MWITILYLYISILLFVDKSVDILWILIFLFFWYNLINKIIHNFSL